MTNKKLVTIDNLKDILPVFKDNILTNVKPDKDKVILIDEEQNLTEEQKILVKNNIGIDSDVILYNNTQYLSNIQQEQARSNIGAAPNRDNNLTTTNKTLVGAINEIKKNSIGKNGTGTGSEIFNLYEDDGIHKANIASGVYSHAEGFGTSALGKASHAEGGNFAHEGSNSYYGRRVVKINDTTEIEITTTTAMNVNTHAEGGQTLAYGENSHSEGYKTNAIGDGSHAEGYETYAYGENSHVEGKGTTASGNYQHVQGKYNISDSEGKYAHIVGNGTAVAKLSNAHTLDWNGNAWYKGNVYIGGASQDEGSKLVTEAEVDAKLQDVEISSHTHDISDITGLETTLSDTASAITINANSISAHSTAISNLQDAINNIEDISSEEIQALFA